MQPESLAGKHFIFAYHFCKLCEMIIGLGDGDECFYWLLYFEFDCICFSSKSSPTYYTLPFYASDCWFWNQFFERLKMELGVWFLFHFFLFIQLENVFGKQNGTYDNENWDGLMCLRPDLVSISGFRCFENFVHSIRDDFGRHNFRLIGVRKSVGLHKSLLACWPIPIDQKVKSLLT